MFSLNTEKILDQLQPESYDREYRQTTNVLLVSLIAVVGIPIIDNLNPNIPELLCGILFLIAYGFLMWGIAGLSTAGMIRRRICKGLAGIECGIYHGEDDLVFLCHMPRCAARSVIAGNMDFLLSHRETCRYMPY